MLWALELLRDEAGLQGPSMRDENKAGGVRISLVTKGYILCTTLGGRVDFRHAGPHRITRQRGRRLADGLPKAGKGGVAYVHVTYNITYREIP